MCWLIFLWKLYILFQDSLMNKKLKRTVFIWNRLYFCNIINVFIATFDKFNASLVNKNIIIILSYWPKTYTQ